MPMYNPKLPRWAVRARRRVTPYARKYGRRLFLGVEAARLGRQVYRNIARKRKTRSYVEQRPSKKARTTSSVAPGGRKGPTRLRMAARLTKFRKMKPAAVKVPKSAIASYKEYGTLQAEKLMYISHDHRGSRDKFWSGIAYGLTKLLMAKAKIYPAKSLAMPMVGVRTNPLDTANTFDNGSNAYIRLVFCVQSQNGNIARDWNEISVLETGTNPNQYKTFQAMAQDVETTLKARYGHSANQTTTEKVWLQEAFFFNDNASSTAVPTYVDPVYVQNLDDAEVHLYAHSLVKLQNITEGDGGSNLTQALDANPLIGRMYQAKGHYPRVDGDVTTMLAGGFTSNALDDFFGDVEPSGFTLHGNSTRTGS